MMKSWLNILMTVILVSTVALPSFAQTPPPPGGNQAESARVGSGPRRQLATIIFAGLGGAILGLSTLSFYGRPQDKLSNIAVGFAIGVIAGTSYVTYTAATRPDEFYGLRPQYEREQELRNLLLSQASGDLSRAPMRVSWSFEF